MINLFKKIKLANKVINTYNEIKKIAKSNAPIAEDLKKVLDNLKADFNSLLALVPALKELYKEVKEALN